MKRFIACHQTGFGFDSHAFARKGALVLGGVEVKGCPALQGHSDGDALLHAVIDALLGGAGLGDIGELFPDTSPAFKGISSRILLRETMKAVRGRGFVPTHVDVTVVAMKPRLSPIKHEMTRTLARLLQIPSSSVNIKGKTPEGLRLFGPRGGIAVWAVADLQKRQSA